MAAIPPQFNEAGARMRLLLVISLGTVSASCDKVPQAAARQERAAPGESEFPRAGNYHIIRDRTEGGALKREEVDRRVDVSNRAAFEELVARDGGSDCRDRQVDIGGGSFSVRMTCDAPDGDIHNIRMEAHGSYSKDSIEIASETSFWGMAIRESANYRLKGS